MSNTTTKTTKHVATATYRDMWAGDVAAFLTPQRTTRHGERVTVYRWLTGRGATCDGLRCGLAAERMLRHAQNHPFFSNVQSVA